MFAVYGDPLEIMRRIAHWRIAVISFGQNTSPRYRGYTREIRRDGNTGTQKSAGIPVTWLY
jgi:hypothetical protein